MYLTCNQAREWLNDNIETLATLAHDKKIVLCPSFESLAHITSVTKKTQISIGAQDCSAHETGAYTGQVSAQSLAELGCTHCIVGHSEQRKYCNNDDLYQKIEQLLNNNITPIVCIQNKPHLSNPSEELEPIIKSLTTHKKELFIAYEPVESIGTGNVPSNEMIQETFEKIIEILDKSTTTKNYQLLYGGSVSEKTINRLKEIPHMRGFLIGRASTDIEKFKKII